ncbi:hypothetical protein FS837_004258 [Tulasnella sp. UAMH 9824]|nr:hypothetical protein FS837_004258 [Tulasnella sp. UAMH 9824]
MVLTRSKSAINYKEVSDDEMGDLNVWGKGATTKEESQSETRPKRKKARISRSSRAAGGSKDRKTSRAGDPFTSLPLDTVYEIFGFLTPLELLQLSRTNKALRSFLMCKRSSIAWKSARAAVTPPVPICPKDLSEPQLAVLLFTKDCTVCGKSPTQCEYVWYTLRLRACKPCFQSSVIFGRTAAQQYSYLDDFRTVLEVLPGENMFQRAQRRVSPSDDYYLIDELQRISATVEQYHFRFEARVEGARQEFERFIEKSRSAASERISSAKTLRVWTEEFQRLRREVKHQLKEARKQEYVRFLLS